MDKVADGLYVGSIHTLTSPSDLHRHNITHVVSLLRDNVRDMTKQGLHHLHVRVDDDDEEDIMKFFSETNRFIDQARSAGGNVLIHCIAGISRSVTVTVAYILSKQHQQDPSKKLSVEDTIKLVKKKRGVANPNPSFRQQLEAYVADGCKVGLENPNYAQWIKQKQEEGLPLTGKKTEHDILKLADSLDVPRKYEIGSAPDDVRISVVPKPRL